MRRAVLLLRVRKPTPDREPVCKTEPIHVLQAPVHKAVIRGQELLATRRPNPDRHIQKLVRLHHTTVHTVRVQPTTEVPVVVPLQDLTVHLLLRNHRAVIEAVRRQEAVVAATAVQAPLTPAREAPVQCLLEVQEVPVVPVPQEVPVEADQAVVEDNGLLKYIMKSQKTLMP
jgi:hypothetical protein